jgi:hypothetical protein
MSNVYRGQPRYGKDITDLMTRISGLTNLDVGVLKICGENCAVGTEYTAAAGGLYTRVSGNNTYICVISNHIYLDPEYESDWYLVHVFTHDLTHVTSFKVYDASVNSRSLGICGTSTHIYVMMYKATGMLIRLYIRKYLWDGTYVSEVSTGEVGGSHSSLVNQLDPSGNLVIALEGEGESKVLYYSQSLVLQSSKTVTFPAYYWTSQGCCVSPDGYLYFLVRDYVNHEPLSIYSEHSGTLTDVQTFPGWLNLQHKAMDLHYDSRTTEYPIHVGGYMSQADVPAMLAYKADLSEYIDLDSSTPFYWYTHSWTCANDDLAFVIGPFGPVWRTYQQDGIEPLTLGNDNALLDSFDGEGSDIALDHITDMRFCVEILNSSYGVYNWNDEDPDNLYYCAMGDRTDYGATGGSRYTWTRTPEEMVGTPTYDIDIGEIHECVNLLK